MDSTHGPIVVRRRLGFVLKQLRGQRGLHLDTVARQLEVSPSKLSRLETGQVEPKIRDVRDLLDIYDADAAVREQVMQWTFDAKKPGWWQSLSVVTLADMDLYISLEVEARSIEIYSTPISGLLQTRDYAREILDGAVPDASPQQLENLVEIRVGRQNVIDPGRPDLPPLELHSIMDEGALLRGPATGHTMRDQWKALLERSEQSNVTIQVHPFEAGYTAASSTFAIFNPRREDDWTVVNVESAGADSYFDAPAEIDKYRRLWQGLLSSSLSPEASRDLILKLTR